MNRKTRRAIDKLRQKEREANQPRTPKEVGVARVVLNEANQVAGIVMTDGSLLRDVRRIHHKRGVDGRGQPVCKLVIELIGDYAIDAPPEEERKPLLLDASGAPLRG